MVIGIDYRYCLIPGRRMFRFEGIYADRWQWSKQPIGKQLEADFNKQIDYSLTQHRRAMQTSPN